MKRICTIPEIKSHPINGEAFPEGLLLLEYEKDRTLLYPGTRNIGYVRIHGWGSHEDQCFVREDMKGTTAFLVKNGYGILSPNLFDNAWMSPEATAELKALIEYSKQRFGWEKIILSSGSMGGSSNLIFAMLYPEMVDVVVANCSVSDLRRQYDWCLANPDPLNLQIAESIMVAYHHDPELIDRNSVLKNAQRLTMPVLLCHGDADRLVPVFHSRELVKRFNDIGKTNFSYQEIPGGDHEAPVVNILENLRKVLRLIK